MRTITKEIYAFAELDDCAKERARDWYRQHVFDDSYDWEYIYEDASNVGKLMGIDLNQRRVRLMNGSVRYDPAIYFSGFSHQGQGCNFEAEYEYQKGAPEAIRKYAPDDAELHRIVDALEAVQEEYEYSIRACVRPKGHYFDMDIDVECEYPENDSILTLDYEVEVKELLSDFAFWIYRQLEIEYDYQTSDEAIEDSICCNGYEFDENGRAV